ncbi:glycosyl hydrolase family 2 [Bacteroidia bacterium]|nr:glycosyl hydrolase family 2 [Bacteroidia bacterium]
MRVYSSPLQESAKRTDSDMLFKAFRNPPVTARPFVRWWWNGDKLDAKEILRELDVLKEAGIGGVEINPIGFPGGDDLSIPSMEWLSPEWIEMVKVALKGAEERGMICDMLVGTGFPFGAETLTRDEQTQLMTLSSLKVEGPATITLDADDLFAKASPEIYSPHKDTLKEVYALCLAPVQMDTFAAPEWLTFDKNTNPIRITVPAGEHILYALIKLTGYQAVIFGAPGGSGPVLNHYDKTVVRNFLNRISDNLLPKLTGITGFRSMFCDSMELEGANWCNDLLAEFKRRKGYDVLPYLPFILVRVGHMGKPIKGGEITQLDGTAKEEIDRVRYDFFTTCVDLMNERFLGTYNEWCHRHGLKSRVQAYGREFHPLDASLLIDIPECESWEDFGNCGINKYVASAAHYTGKKIISCEELTNGSTFFNATLERLKLTGDMSNLSGVNHSILHGFNYSPLEVPFPGWVRYGSFLSERNLWWPWFKLFTAYKTRLSLVLQESEAFADIAVMHPLADMWALYGTQREPFPAQHPKYQYSVWDSIHKNGNSCDYTSEFIIRQSVVENGFLTYNSRKYHTLILVEVESIMPATAEKLANFVKKGGKLIFVGKEPYKSPGLKDYKKNDRKVAQTISTLKRTHSSRVFTVEAPGDDLIAWFKGVQQKCGIKPYMEIDQPNLYVNQIRQRTKDKDIFFVSNCNADKRFVLKAAFPESKGRAWLWDIETGERCLYPAAVGNTLTLDLPPAASQLIVFDTTAEDTPAPLLPAETQGTELQKWHLSMEHINGTTQKRNITALSDLSTDKTTRSFAGHLLYEQTIDSSESYNWLDLGKVYGISEVVLNGEKLGCHWYGRHLYRIPEHLAKAGKKTIQIKVTTTLGNYFKSNPQNNIGNSWAQWQEWYPMGVVGPVKLL